MVRRVSTLLTIALLSLSFITGATVESDDKGLSEQEDLLSIFVGTWGDAFQNYYCFYHDSNFRLYYSFDKLDPRDYSEGTWALTDSTLTITITALYVIEGCAPTMHWDANCYITIGGTEIKYDLDPHWVRKYGISGLDIDESRRYIWDELYTFNSGDMEIAKIQRQPFPRNEEERLKVDEFCGIS